MSKNYEDKANNLAHIQKNLQSMKLAASEFLRKSGNPELPPITKARHYLFHSIYNQVMKPRQKQHELTYLNKELDFPAQQMTDLSTEGSPIFRRSKLLSEDNSKKKCIKKSICGLEIKKTIEKEINEQNWHVKKVLQFDAPIKRGQQKSIRQSLSIQVKKSKKPKTIQKHPICFNTVDFTALIPDSETQLSGKKHSFLARKKSRKNEQFLTIRSSRLGNVKSSLDNYQDYNQQREQSGRRQQSFYQERNQLEAKQLDYNLKNYFKAMKQKFTGSLQLQKGILQRSRNSRNKFLISRCTFNNKYSLQLSQQRYAQSKKELKKSDRSAIQVQFTPWKVENQYQKAQESALSCFLYK